MTALSNVQPLSDPTLINDLNSVFGKSFTTKYGKKWSKFTTSKGTAVRLESLIPNEEAMKWFRGKLDGKVECFKFIKLSDSNWQLILPEPVNFCVKVKKTNQLGLATTICRFPHMYVEMMNSSLIERTNCKILVVGQGIIIPKDFGEVPPYADDVYFPQASELFYLFPRARVTLMDKSTFVVESLSRLKDGFIYLPSSAENLLNDQHTFSRQNEKYQQLAKIFSSPITLPEDIVVVEGDIAQKAINDKFDVIVATKVLLYIPEENTVKTPEEQRSIALKTLSHLFQDLSSNGKLYIDQESLEALCKASKRTLDQLLEEVSAKLNLPGIAKHFIPHDVIRFKGQHYCIEAVVTSTGQCIGAQTDNIYVFSFNSLAPPAAKSVGLG